MYIIIHIINPVVKGQVGGGMRGVGRRRERERGESA
jgi:hypothetical protein